MKCVALSASVSFLLGSPRSPYKVSPDHPSGLTKEQTTETMDTSPKTKGLRPYPRQRNLKLVEVRFESVNLMLADNARLKTIIFKTLPTLCFKTCNYIYRLRGGFTKKNRTFLDAGQATKKRARGIE